jgi:polyisoprenoid-binding protein YceI
MSRSVIGRTAVGTLAVAGASFAYLFWFAGGSGEPSTQLTTPGLSTTTTGAEATSTQATTQTTARQETTSSEATASSLSFVIDQAQSEARFEIDEVLNGNPTHVVGTTGQVVGQFRVDLADVGSVEFSELIINARALDTGSERRNRAIRGPVILDSGSDAHELITFRVTSVEGLDGSSEPGTTFEFSVSGDLSIKGTTQPVTFDANVTQLDETTIVGSATAQVTRDMFEIGIPSLRGVADVTNEVLIGLEFVAVAE